MDQGKGVGLIRERDSEKRTVAGLADEAQCGASSQIPHEWLLKLESRRLEQALDRLRYRSPRPDQVTKYAALRDAAAAFVTVIVRNTPESSDALDALESVERALMLANKSIALGT